MITLRNSIALLVLSLLILNPLSTFSQSPISAFSFSSETLSDSLGVRTASATQEIPSWPIELSVEFIELSEGRTFLVPLPSGEPIAAEVTTRTEYDNGDVQLIAKVAGGGSIVITIGDDVVFGSINDGTVSYSIGLDNNRQIALLDNQSMQDQMDLSNDMRFAPTALAGQRAAHSSLSLQDLEILSAQNTAATTIDLLVVYSNEFATLFGTPQTRINQLVSFTNTSFADSGILINLRLVAAVQIGFDNANSLGVILGNATDGVGDFTSLPALRNQYGADLVAVLGASSNNGAAGLAWVLNGSENPQNGVSTTKLSINCCDAVFAHEIGHNLGSVHQLGDCNGGYTGFSCGFEDSVNEWATVMSSGGNQSVIGYLFSNTDNDCLGFTCGLAGAADNRTSFNMSRLVVAEFRDEIEPSEPRPPINTEIGWLPAILFNLLLDEEN